MNITLMAELIRKWKIKERLVILFFLASLLPMILITVVMYRQTSNTLYQNMNYTVSSVNDQSASYISEKIKKVISDSVEISNSELVQNILLKYGEYDSIKLYQMTKEIIRQMSNKYVFNDIITEITLYLPSRNKVNLYGPYTYRYKPTETELTNLIMQAEEERRVLFSLNAKNSMILFRSVKNKEDQTIIGYLLIRIDENRISEIYSNSLYGLGTEAFVMNADGIIVSSDESSTLSTSIIDENLLEKLNIAKQNGKKEFSMEWKEKRQIVNYSAIEGTDWNIVSIIPESFFKVNVKQLFMRMLWIVIVCLFFSVAISLFVAFSILKPLNTIVYSMREYHNEQSAVMITDNGSDELTFMADTFNEMSARLNKQMQDIRKAETQKRKLEIQALQAQINPHFIANTLNLISNIASVNEMTSIGKLSDSLVNLVRDCCKADEYFTSVHDEISMLQSYINIQDYRMLGKFSVQMQISPDIEELFLPHLILQPIVENAILHGILPNRKKRGLISIHGYINQKELVFSVTDNGIGMSQERIKQVMEGSLKDKEKGRFNSIGMQNVHQRIQLLFGEKYGLYIYSAEGIYTTVMIHLPIITEQEAQKNV